MDIIDTHLEGVKVIIPKIWEDDRGYFYESYQKEKYHHGGIKANFIQDNEAFSKYGAVRGLHYQLPPKAQAKLVRVTQGEVLDVVVDIRPESKTYGKSLSIILNDINRKQLYIPEGFAHGYAVLSETAVFMYKCNQYYAPDFEGGIHINDPSLNIDWIIPEGDKIISEKDMQLPLFGQHKSW